VEALPLPRLHQALQWLDHRLMRAVAAAEAVHGPGSATDSYRGLYVGRDDVVRVLARSPGVPFPQVDGEDDLELLPDSALKAEPFSRLRSVFGLSSFDAAVVVIALAPELDLRYELVYAYLQDDVTRKRPSVDLALNLLCASARARLDRRAHFSADAPLLRHGLLHLIADPLQLQPPLLAQFLKLDDQIVNLLLGQAGLDGRLTSFGRVVEPAGRPRESVLTPEIKSALSKLAEQARGACQPLRLYFQLAHDSRRSGLPEALADAAATRVLAVDLARAPAAPIDFEKSLQVVLREAWFQDATLHFDGLDTLRGAEQAARLGLLLDALTEHRGSAVLAGAEPWMSAVGPSGFLSVLLEKPDYSQRRASWRRHLAAAQVPLGDEDLDALASRFRLTSEQIADAVASARNQSRWQNALEGCHGGQASPSAGPGVGINALFAAARAQAGPALEAIARKIEPKSTWDDIVLPPDALGHLREIGAQARYRHVVYGQWGFDRKLSLGKDLTVLFSGHPGTGKTMAAEALARELGLDLYKIDLSRVVSKYIGETEKNLDRVFNAAERASAILFFDEADALFGKRSQVKDAHDRYANIEIGYLLQKMEEYEGVAILATNLRTNMDEAFLRRLKFHVEFPFPEEESRYRIWAGLFPPQAPRSPELDFDFLARRFKVAGGNIKNMVLNASFLAAADGRPIGMEHVIRAARREFQKMGMTCTAADFGEYFGLVK